MSQINETAIKTPGVYINEIPSFPPSVAQVSTAIPVFIGYTAKALDAAGNSLTKIPTKIFSLLEFVQFFGKAVNEADINVAITKTTSGGVVTSVSGKASINTPSKHNMYYNMRLYFDNGGGPCYILSVGPMGAGIVDTDLEAGLNIIEAYDEPTLIVFPEGIALLQDPANAADANDSTKYDESKYYALIGKAIDQCAKLQDRFTIIDVIRVLNTDTTTTSINFFRNIAPHLTGLGKNNNLSYGAAYYPYLKTTYGYQYSDADVDVVITTDGVAAAAVKLSTLLATDKATYFASVGAIQKLTITLPPSSAIAGVYAAVDGSRGVWKAPANVSLNSVFDITDIVTDEEQQTMNIDADSGKSVNAIRAFSGKGILIWGGRTLDGNSSEWRYISVRRFFIMVEESVKKATAQFVFEPNDANTWVRLRAMIENYLTLLWRQGALAGAKPEHAFFVRVGLGQTMTANDILDGKLIVEIGLAAVRPAEFIILRFMHKMQES
jgi:phage tail sheath protein FI